MILLLRGEKVMLDADLGELYGVRTKNLVKAVKRNKERFPGHFMFQLNRTEYDSLRFQFGTSKGKGGRRYRPYVFTEQGVAMLSSVLRSKKAIQINIKIMDAFVRLRRVLESNRQLSRRIDEHDKKLAEHGTAISVVVDEIKKLTSPPEKPKRKIGF